jgi:hypothetical protein
MDGQKDIGDLMQNGIRICMLRMHGVPRNRTLEETSVLVDGQEIKEGVCSKPTVRIVPPAWTTRFGAVERKARYAVENAFPEEKSDANDLQKRRKLRDLLPVACYAVSAAKYDKLEEEVDRINRDELFPLRQRFAEAYPAILEDLRKEINSAAVWGRLEPKLPKAKDLATGPELMLTRLPFTFVDEAGRKYAEDLAMGIVGGIADKLAKAVGSFNSKTRFREGSLNEMRKQFEMLRDFEFLASPETISELYKAEQAVRDLGEDYHSVLNESVQTAEKNVIAGIGAALSSLVGEVRKDAGGRFRRSIRV